VRASIGRDVPQEDDALGIEARDEGGEALACDVADGQHEGLDPRRGDGQKRVDSHSCAAVMPDVWGKRRKSGGVESGVGHVENEYREAGSERSGMRRCPVRAESERGAAVVCASRGRGHLSLWDATCAGNSCGGRCRDVKNDTEVEGWMTCNAPSRAKPQRPRCRWGPSFGRGRSYGHCNWRADQGGGVPASAGQHSGFLEVVSHHLNLNDGNP
jgi:hypothetical protein